jgi:hypothetical protein
MVMRSALIGILIAVLVVSGLIFLPERLSKSDVGDLPPRLFPMFPGEEEEMKEELEAMLPEARVRINKIPRKRELTPGNAVTFSLVVENISKIDLKDLTLEELFDATYLSVEEAGGGSIGENRITWNIPLLRPKQAWSTRYQLLLKPDTDTDELQTTAYVVGEDLQEMTSAERLISSTLTVIPMPEAGAKLGPVSRLLSDLLHHYLYFY